MAGLLFCSCEWALCAFSWTKDVLNASPKCRELDLDAIWMTVDSGADEHRKGVRATKTNVNNDVLEETELLLPLLSWFRDFFRNTINCMSGIIESILMWAPYGSPLS